MFDYFPWMMVIVCVLGINTMMVGYLLSTIQKSLPVLQEIRDLLKDRKGD